MSGDGTHDVGRFFEAYSDAFLAFDAEAIADLFTFPCQVIGWDDEITVLAVSSRAEWLAQITRLVGGYRWLGVATANRRYMQTHELATGLVLALVGWRLCDDEGNIVYDFEAAYTLVDLHAEYRIAAIAHNETPSFRDALRSLGS